MNKIRTSVKVTEIDTLSGNLTAFYKDDAKIAEDTFLKDIMEQMASLSDSLTTAIKQDKAESILDEKDGVRDQAIKDLCAMIDGYCAFPMPAKKEAALSLKAVFDKYGKKMINESFANESSLIESMLKDFAADGITEKIAILDGIAEILASIRTAQDDFSECYKEYAQKSAAQKSRESATSLKKTLLTLINSKLIKYLDTMAMVDKEKYSGFALLTSREIDKLNTQISARSEKKNPQPEA